MRVALFGALGLSFACSAVASAQQRATAGAQQGRVPTPAEDSAIVAREWAVWNAIKSNDSAAVVNLLGKRRIAFVEPGGAYRVSTERWAGRITKQETRRSELDQFVIDHLSETTVLLTYRVTLDRNCAASACDHAPLKLTAMTVWVRRGGRWEAAAQSVTPLGRL